MGVGCPCPPVRNDIVTPRHLFNSFLQCIVSIQLELLIIKLLTIICQIFSRIMICYEQNEIITNVLPICIQTPL